MDKFGSIEGSDEPELPRRTDAKSINFILEETNGTFVGK